MGYDMHTRVESPEMALAKANIDLAYAADDREALTDAYRAYGDAETPETYFRLNIWGMGVWREVMENLGMAYWADEEPPPWPDPDAYGVPKKTETYVSKNEQGEDVERSYEDWDRESPEWEPVEEANDAVLAWSPEPERGMALHKFCSNDGWWVTAEECRNALALYEKAELDPLQDAIEADQLDEEYWQEWLAFLRAATVRDGFQVY